MLTAPGRQAWVGWNRGSWKSGSIVLLLLCVANGCASMKQSDTARTGIEQLLISSAADRALAKVDLQPIAGAKIYIEEKYLECVDKNYILVALHQRLMHNGCTLVAKAEDAQVVVEVGSGGVGTDRSESFIGIPEIPLPPPSPISVPKLALFERVRAMGTVKLVLLAYDAKTHVAVVNSGYVLARADHRATNMFGLGGVNSGSVHDELLAATGDKKFSVINADELIARRHPQQIAAAPAPTTLPSVAPSGTSVR